MHTPDPTGITRRQASLWLTLGGLGSGVQAQTASEAALEARAPALPAIGSVLQVPDIALLDGLDLGVAVAPDHHLSSGTIILETGEGWIEDGPQVRLTRLRALFDSMGLPR